MWDTKSPITADDLIRAIPYVYSGLTNKGGKTKPMKIWDYLHLPDDNVNKLYMIRLRSVGCTKNMVGCLYKKNNNRGLVCDGCFAALDLNLAQMHCGPHSKPCLLVFLVYAPVREILKCEPKCGPRPQHDSSHMLRPAPTVFIHGRRCMGLGSLQQEFHHLCASFFKQTSV